MAKFLKVCYGDFVELVDGRKGTVKYIGRSQWHQIGGQLNTDIVFGVLLDDSSNLMSENQFMLSLTNQAVVTLPNQISKILHEDKDFGNKQRISVNDMVLHKRKYKCGVIHYIGEIEDDKDDEVVYCVQLIETDAQGKTGISSGGGNTSNGMNNGVSGAGGGLGVFVKSLDDLVLIESNYLDRVRQEMKPNGQASPSVSVSSEQDDMDEQEEAAIATETKTTYVALKGKSNETRNFEFDEKKDEFLSKYDNEKDNKNDNNNNNNNNNNNIGRDRQLATVMEGQETEKQEKKEKKEKDLGLGVIQMANEDLWKRRTTNRLTVLKIRRQTMRNFEENTTVPIKDIITDYDSKKGGLLDATKNMKLRRSVAGNLYDASKDSNGVTSDKLNLSEINQYISKTLFGGFKKSKSKGILKTVEKEKLNITIIPDCQWIVKTQGNDSGKLIFGKSYDNNRLAVDIGTTSKLAYYDVKLLGSGDTDGTPIHLPFNANMADYYYSSEYINKYVLNPKRGVGIETHSFPHFDRPLSDDSGYFILGKRVYTEKQKEINNKAAKIANNNKNNNNNTENDNSNETHVDIFDLHLTAFIIPTNYWIYIPPNVIHSNDYLHGNWTTLLSWNIDINHVRIGHKLKGGDMFEWRFFHVKDETLKLRHKETTTKVPKYDSKTLQKQHIYRVKIQSVK